jgi:hypothetical protein
MNSETTHTLKGQLDDEVRLRLKKNLSKLNCLYIIDAGDGMNQKIIRDHWMTIGTDIKAVEVFTKTGRVKAGAKGIAVLHWINWAARPI